MTFFFRAWSPRRITVVLGQTMLAAASVVCSAHDRAVAKGLELVSPSAQRGAATVAALQVIPGEVDLSLSAPVGVHREYLRGNAQKADRCYVDLSPASFNAQAHSVFDLSTGPIQRVRISQFHEGVVRVVLDLRGSHDCQVNFSAEPYRLSVIVAGTQVAQTAMDQLTVAQSRPRVQESEASLRQENASSKEVLLPTTWQIATQQWPLLAPAREGASSAMRITAATEEAQSNHLPDDQAPSALLSDESRTESAPGLLDPPPSFPEMIASVEQLSASEPTSAPAFAQELKRIGGEIVHEFWMIMMGASILLSFFTGGGVVFLWNARKRGAQSEKNVKGGKNDGWEARMAYLEEAVNRAGMLNSSFFHSLEITQKRLEALLTQADLAGQNLRRLLHQSAMSGAKPTGRNTDAYATAALLLAEGEDVQQVARVLKLPVAQVRLVQELRQSTQEEKATDGQEKSAETPHESSLVVGLKSFVAQHNGAPRHGTPLAQNG